MRYAGFLTLLSIFQGTVNMNLNGLVRYELRFLLLDF